MKRNIMVFVSTVFFRSVYFLTGRIVSWPSLSFALPLRINSPPYEHGSYKNPGYQEN